MKIYCATTVPQLGVLFACCMTLGHVVNGSEVFEVEPEDITVTFVHGTNPGTSEQIFLDCKLYNTLETNQKIVWFKNDIVISEGRNLNQVMDNSIDYGRYRIPNYSNNVQYPLLIRDVTSSTATTDSGRYQCVVIWDTAEGAAIPDGRSRTATVNVYVIPRSGHPLCTMTKSADVGTTSTTIGTGETRKLTCFSDRGVPDVSLHWSKDDNVDYLQPTSENINIDLVFIHYNWTPLPNDHGSTPTFICTVQHPGLSSDRTCTLGPFDIQYPPIVTLDPKNVNVTNETEMITFTCDGNANPTVYAAVNWFYDDELVIANNHFRFDEQALHVSGFNAVENGLHTIICVLTNNIGNGNDSATLNVNISVPGTVEKGSSTIPNIITIDSNTQSDINPTESNHDKPYIPGNSNKTNIGAIVGGTVGVVVLLVTVVILFVLICFIKRRKNPNVEYLDKRRTANENEYVVDDRSDVQSFSSPYATIHDTYVHDSGTTINMDNMTPESTSHTVDNIQGKEEPGNAGNTDVENMYAKPQKKFKAKAKPKDPIDENYADISTKEQSFEKPDVNDLDAVPHEQSNSYLDVGPNETQNRGKAKKRKPRMKPKPNAAKSLNIDRRETPDCDRGYDNAGKMRSTTRVDDGYREENNAYANLNEPCHASPELRLYDDVKSSEIVDRKEQSGAVAGDTIEFGQSANNERVASMKNVEGLTYADLDFGHTGSSENDRRGHQQLDQSDATVYAHVVLP